VNMRRRGALPCSTGGARDWIAWRRGVRPPYSVPCRTSSCTTPYLRLSAWQFSGC
jgi:hypothetical protein